VLLFILAVFIAATFLRLNNIGMVERRAAFISADESGNSEATIMRLYDLQRYVSAHMNTDMGKGVALEDSYKRDSQAAIDAASLESNPNGNIYKKAQEVCAPQFSRYSYAYLQCTTGELAKYPSATSLDLSLKLPDPDTYFHSFNSPLWSPDFAGWSVVICIALLVVIVTRMISLLILRAMLHHHYKSV